MSNLEPSYHIFVSFFRIKHGRPDPKSSPLLLSFCFCFDVFSFIIEFIFNKDKLCNLKIVIIYFSLNFFKSFYDFCEFLVVSVTKLWREFRERGNIMITSCSGWYWYICQWNPGGTFSVMNTGPSSLHSEINAIRHQNVLENYQAQKLLRNKKRAIQFIT